VGLKGTVRDLLRDGAIPSHGRGAALLAPLAVMWLVGDEEA
jgi:hypothetical protein